MLTDVATRARLGIPTRGRRIVLIDIENIVGGAVTTLDQAQWAKQLFENRGVVNDSDQLIFGTCRLGAVNIGATWQSSRIVMQDGDDGADLALLNILETEDLASRYDEVLIISGDHIFTDAIAALRADGVHVTVAGWADHLSAHLRLVANTTYFLDDLLSQTDYTEAA